MKWLQRVFGRKEELPVFVRALTVDKPSIVVLKLPPDVWPDQKELDRIALKFQSRLLDTGFEDCKVVILSHGCEVTFIGTDKNQENA